MHDRRDFLARAGGGLAALLGAPAVRAAAATADGAAPPPLPPRDLYARDEEAYWTEMRKQFLIPPDEVFLNCGTVGSSPWPVLRAVFDGYEDTERMAQDDPEDYPIWGRSPRSGSPRGRPGPSAPCPRSRRTPRAGRARGTSRRCRS